MFRTERLKLIDTLVLGLIFCVAVSLFMVNANLQTRKQTETVFYPVQEVVVKTTAQPRAAANIKPLPVSSTIALPIVPPQVLNAVLPEYPVSAKEKGAEGITLLQVYIEPSGAVNEVKLVQSSGNQLLDETAGQAVKHWTFRPAKQGLLTIGSWLEIPIRFMLNS